MSYTNRESANLLTNASNFSQRRRIDGRFQSSRHNTLIKNLVCDTINCALAHWYLLPGLELQRYRLRLAFSLIRTPQAARHEFSTLPATMYLDSDFALKSLRAQPRIGSYLDVSSPWVFPFYVLTALKPDQAILLNSSGATRNLFKHFAKQTECKETEAQMKELAHLSGLAESFDTLTCLAPLSAEEKERELVRKMWQALNPGGTLILSVACTGPDSRTERDTDAPDDGSNPHSVAPPYDSERLKSHVLDVLGEPRSYAIFSEDSVVRRLDRFATMSDPPTTASWRESVGVGRYWHRCSSISQVRSRGILAMKFTKSASLSAARQVS